MNVVRLQTSAGDNLYRYGERFSSGYPGRVESFVKDADARSLLGRWLPCPNLNVGLAISRLPA